MLKFSTRKYYFRNPAVLLGGAMIATTSAVREGPQPGLRFFCIALVPRLAYLLIVRPAFDTEYWTLAGSILGTRSFVIGGTKVTDFEPLYPLFLVLCRAIAGDRIVIIQLLQICVASMGAVYMYRLALRLSSDARAAAIGATLFAFHPLLIRQSAAASDLALVATLLPWFAYAFVSIRNTASAAIAGGALGLAVLTRFMVLPVAVCGFVVLLVDGKRARAGAFGVVVLLLAVAWPIRNHAVNGSWWPTRSGMNLYIGNSPYTAALLPSYDLDLLEDSAYDLFARERPELSPSSPEYPAALDAFLSKRALAYMIESPVRTLRRKLLNVVYMFSPRIVPYDVAGADTKVVVNAAGDVIVENSIARPRVEIWAHAVAMSLVLLTAAVGVFMRRRRLGEDVILWSIVATFVVVNAVYVPATRYAAPMLFALLFYSGVALAGMSFTLVSRWRA